MNVKKAATSTREHINYEKSNYEVDKKIHTIPNFNRISSTSELVSEVFLLLAVAQFSECKRLLVDQSTDEYSNDFYVFLVFGIVFTIVIFFLLYLAIKNKSFERLRQRKRKKAEKEKTRVELQLSKAPILARNAST